MSRSATAPTIPHMCSVSSSRFGAREVSGESSRQPIIRRSVLGRSVTGRFQPSSVELTCCASRVSLPAGASRVIVEPAPIVAPAPIFTGATSIDARADERAVADHGARLVHAVVVAGDGAGADVDLLADRRVAEVGEVVGLRAALDSAFFTSTKLPMCTSSRSSAPRAQPRERADDAARADRRADRARSWRGSRCRRRSRCRAARSSARCARDRRACTVPSNTHVDVDEHVAADGHRAAHVEARRVHERRRPPHQLAGAPASVGRSRVRPAAACR